MAVVVVDELAEDVFEVAPIEDQHAVEALTADGADDALGEGVGTWSTDRCADDPNTLGTEDLVEAGGELGVPISDQEPHRLISLHQLEGQVSGLLDDPGSARMSRDTGH